MKKLQAAMRDRAARNLKETRVMYRVGSFMKGCDHCGDFYIDETGPRPRKVFTSGFQVFRSFHPSQTRWTYWCWECGAKDQVAWANAGDIGEDAVRKPKSDIEVERNLERPCVIEAAAKAKAAANDRASVANAVTGVQLRSSNKQDERTQKIDEIQKKLAMLEELLKNIK